MPIRNPEDQTEVPEHARAMLAVLERLGKSLKPKLVSTDPAIVTLEYEPVPIDTGSLPSQAEINYRIWLYLVENHLDLLGREMHHGHGHGHGEVAERVNFHEGHTHNEGTSETSLSIPALSEMVMGQVRNVLQLSRELVLLVTGNIVQTFLKSGVSEEYAKVQWKERHLTKAGATHLRDCREFTNEKGEVVYIMPAKEYEKIKGKGLHFKDEKIRKGTRPWVEEVGRIPADDVTDKDVLDISASFALRGETMYVVPILSGLKPAGFESCGLGVKRSSLPMLEQLSIEMPNQIQIVNMNGALLIYNPSAVDQVLRSNPEVFEALGIQKGTHPHNVIEQVLIRYNMEEGVEMTPEFSKAVGLLLGYDEYSIDNYDSWVGQGWGPHVYQFNEQPLCLWGVDYAIVDPETNSGYQEQVKSYGELLKWIEDQLEKGERPYEILKKMPLHREQAQTHADVAGTLD